MAGLYNLSEFITMIKENIGIKDLPLPVDDNRLLSYFDRSVLSPFSIIYPRIHSCLIGEECVINKGKETLSLYYEYQIPPWDYEGTIILDVASFEPVKPNGYSDFFIPSANWATPDAVIGAIADVRMAAGLASSMSKAPTHEFIKPNILHVYNGWAGGIYRIELLLKHDLNLSTIPDGAFLDLEELATYSIKAFYYNELKRKDNLEVGVGSFNLKLDDWADAENQRRELLKTWREDGANFDFEHLTYY